MEKLLLTIFIFSLVPIIIMILYPVWSWLGAALFNKQVNKSLAAVSPASIIIACYNEVEYIEAKIRSILSDENWIPGSELIIVSGGSNDGTNDILRKFADRNEVQLILLKERTAKIDAVNMAVRMSKHDLLVFSDCRQQMKSGSIAHLLANFNDPEIGTVAATLSDNKEGGKESFFRKMYNKMAIKDSSYSSCLNVYGALYAQRKCVFREIPSNLLFDDLFVVVSTLAQRKRLIQDEKAVIFDLAFDFYYGKERIRRLVRGLLIFFFSNSALIFSLHKGTLMRFLIYKYLKLLLPYFLQTAAISGFFLIVINERWWLLILLTSLIAVTVLFIKKQVQIFIRINFNILIASLLYVSGMQRSNKWEKLNVNKN